MVEPVSGPWPPEALAAPQKRPQAPPEPREREVQEDAVDADLAPCEGCPPEPKRNGRALAVCTVDRCMCRVRQGRCSGCNKRAARGRRSNKSQGRDARWYRESRRYLRAHPYCECDECLEMPDILRPRADVVDHIDGLGPAGPRGYDWSNLRSMTRAHHSRHTGRTQPGGWNDRE